MRRVAVGKVNYYLIMLYIYKDRKLTLRQSLYCLMMNKIHFWKYYVLYFRRSTNQEAVPPLILMELARVAARTDRGLQLHREAWPLTAHYWLDTRYAPRVLHFSAFHICGIWCSITSNFQNLAWKS